MHAGSSSFTIQKKQQSMSVSKSISREPRPVRQGSKINEECRASRKHSESLWHPKPLGEHAEHLSPPNPKHSQTIPAKYPKPTHQSPDPKPGDPSKHPVTRWTWIPFPQNSHNPEPYTMKACSPEKTHLWEPPKHHRPPKDSKTP